MTGHASVSTQDGAQSIRRAIAILRIVAAGQERGVRLTDVMSATGLNSPTAHRILRALLDEGAVEQDPSTRRYLIGLARPTGFPLRSLAMQHLAQLGEDLGETTFLTIRNGDDSVCLARALGSYPIKVLAIDVGVRRLLGVGVSGVVLLASLPYAEAVDMMRRNANRLRALGLDGDDILDRCATASVLGYAYTSAGLVRGTRAIAVPVQTSDGTVIAGIAMTAISSRLSESRLHQIVEKMQIQAQQIAAKYERIRR
jgi:DNA-binding IclR family transcriptional regulator